MVARKDTHLKQLKLKRDCIGPSNWEDIQNSYFIISLFAQLTPLLLSAHEPHSLWLQTVLLHQKFQLHHPSIALQETTFFSYTKSQRRSLIGRDWITSQVLLWLMRPDNMRKQKIEILFGRFKSTTWSVVQRKGHIYTRRKRKGMLSRFFFFF